MCLCWCHSLSGYLFCSHSLTTIYILLSQKYIHNVLNYVYYYSCTKDYMIFSTFANNNISTYIHKHTRSNSSNYNVTLYSFLENQKNLQKSKLLFFPAKYILHTGYKNSTLYMHKMLLTL